MKQNHLVHNTSIIRNNSPRSKNCGQQLSRASPNSDRISHIKRFCIKIMFDIYAYFVIHAVY